MPKISKYNCGNVIPSSCVPFTGKDLTFLSEEDLELFPCDANINDVIFYIDKYLKVLVDGNNFTELDKDCFDFDPLTIDAKGLHQLEITKICLLEGRVTAVEDQLADLNIGAETLVIDLLCLTPDAEACAVATNTYTLQSILQLFVAKLCDHETRILELEAALEVLSPVNSPGLNSFAYFWQSVIDVTGTIASNNSKVLFESSAVNNTADITTVSGTGNITIGANAGGLYKISWLVAGAEANAFAVFKGNTKQLGSVYGSGAGTQQNNGFVLLSLAAGDVISLRSDNAPAAITLQLAGTTDTDQVVASIFFEKFN